MEPKNQNIRNVALDIKSFNHRSARKNTISAIRRLLGVLLVLLNFAAPYFTSLAASRSINIGESGRGPEPIELGKPINARLAGEQSHSYRLTLTANQYVHLLVDQKGIDVVVTLFGPDGKKLLTIDDPYGSEGVEDLFAIANAAGDYLVEVKALRKVASPGKYTIQINELRPATPVDYDRVRAFAAFTEGKILAMQGGPQSLLQAALAKYKEALSLYAAIGDRSQDVKILLRIGNVWSDLDENRKAIDYFTEALSLLRDQADDQLEADVLSRIGYAYLRLGESQNALEYSTKALMLIEKSGNRKREAFALYNLGTIYYSLGSLQDSRQYLTKALIISEEIGNIHLAAYPLQSLGRLYLDLGENEKAFDYLCRSVSLSEKLQDRRAQALGLSELAKAYTALGKMDEALAALEKALVLSRELGMRSAEAQALNTLGMTYSLIGKNEEALNFFYRSLMESRIIDDPRIEVEALYGIAKTQWVKGDFVNSKQTIESAIPIIDSLRSKIGSLQIRQNYFASVQKIYGLYIDVLMQMHRLEPLKGFDVLAFQANEGIRARNLLEMLRTSNIDIRQGIDPSLLQKEQSLQHTVNEIAQRKMRLMGTKDEEEAAAVTKSLENLLSQYEEVEAEIRVTSPRYAALTKPAPLTVADIQTRVLGEDTLLLEFALGDERSFLWAVRNDSIQSYELPGKAVIEAKARQLIEMLKSPSRHDKQSKTASGKTPYLEVASRLSSVLLGPVAKELGGAKRLLIVSDGILQFLPFGALPNPLNSGRPHVVQPLILQHEIVYAPSASIVETLRRDRSYRNPPPKTVAVFGDPVFSKNDERLAKVKTNEATSVLRAHSTLASQDSETTPLKLQRLLYTRLEAEAIVNLAPKGQTMKALDFAANRRAVINGDLNQYRIVHFATHGFIDSSHPELSGIVLSLYDERGTPQNGFLRLNEIFNLNLSADMVVLSGCSTGLGREVKGEGVIGLTRGFMYAGASRVVVSLWSTDDRATATLMNRFYSEMLRGGLKPSAALRAAQIQMWRDKGWSDPYYWAAFVLQGDW